LKYAVGLSGGVDSSVTAALLKENGHEVIGVTMRIHDETDVSGAEKVAEHLNLPFHVIDLRKDFQEKIVSYIRNEYLAARTPNPCMMCNHQIKFGLFLEKLTSSGVSFDYFATGHYARKAQDEKKLWYLIYDKTNPKDQTYFLSQLTQKQIARIQFPLLGMEKEKVRTLAEGYRLPTAHSKDSQDLCSGDYKQYFDKNADRSGNIVDTTGRIIGQHKGIHNYTLGQRKGLCVSAPHPLYVVGINADNDEVVLGTNDDLHITELIAGPVSWCGNKPVYPAEVWARIRYGDKGAEAVLTTGEGEMVKVVFKQPRRAATPGQFAVFYKGDKLLGGGPIQ